MSDSEDIVRLFDIDEVSALTRRSKTWLYRHAGVDIPVTQKERGGRLWWSAAQINVINTMDAVEPQAASASRKASAPAKKTAKPQTSNVSTMRLPVARPDAKRLGRRAS